MPRERKSLDEHVLQGTKPAYTETDSLVVASRPKIPSEFPKGTVLRKWFKQYCADLEKRRTLTSGDAELLRIAVILRDRHARAIEHLRNEGEVCKYQRLDADGHAVDVVKENLWVKIAANSEKQLVSILDRLGLTPLQRGKVKPTDKAKSDEEKAGEALLSREAAQRQKDAEESEQLLNKISDEELAKIQ